MRKDNNLAKIVALQDNEIYQLKNQIKKMAVQNEKCFETILKLEEKIRSYEKITYISSLMGIL